MKNLSQKKYILSALLLAACSGPGSKNPVSDLNSMREDAKAESQRGSDAPRETIKYVPQEEVKTKEEATLNQSYVKIEIDKKDTPLRFFESTATSAKIRLRVLDPDIQMRLTAKGLPEGATLKDVSTVSDPNAYELKWTPPLYTISFNEEAPKVMTATLVPELVSAKTPAKEASVRAMFLEQTVAFSIFRTQEKPSELAVSGLSNKADEGQTTPFSVVARIPGIDDKSPQKPTIGYFKDNTTQVAGTTYREMDGSRYVKDDESRTSAEYLGDFKWKFNLVFDTKNTPVEAQKAKDGSIVTNADTTHVRFGLKVYAPFTATNATIVQVAIKRTPAPAVTAPAPAPTVPETPKAAPKAPQKAPAKTPSKTPTKKAK